LCHNFCIIKTYTLKKEKDEVPQNFMGKFAKSYLIKKLIDIHAIKDYYLARILINKIK